MSNAFNLSQLANSVNSAGQLQGSAITGAVQTSQAIETNNFSIIESGGKLMFYYGLTAIASMDSSGNFTQLGNVTGFGTP